jgi:hypothetical protein
MIPRIPLRRTFSEDEPGAAVAEPGTAEPVL